MSTITDLSIVYDYLPIDERLFLKLAELINSKLNVLVNFRPVPTCNYCLRLNGNTPKGKASIYFNVPN